MHQVHIGQILDVAAVECELSQLWQGSAAEQEHEDSVLMRARVANLIVLLPDDSDLDELNPTLQELSAVHPHRAIVNVAARQDVDRDIELYVSSFCQSDSRGGKRLSCEEIILIARGRFVPELPSAALPLLIPDLPTFLWWRDVLEFDERTFLDFSRASDRLVIDSVEAGNSRSTMLTLARLFEAGRQQQLGISDINWARLTSWRALLASFYDSPRCQTPLSRISSVVIEYSAPEYEPDEVAPQALLLLGWLATRLKWGLSPEPVQKEPGRLCLAALLEAASSITLADKELCIEFPPEARHFRDTLAKSDNVKVLRDVCQEITSSDVGVRIVIQDPQTRDVPPSKEDEERREKQMLRETAEKNPVVQNMLRTFRGEIVDVRRVDPE